MPDPAGGTMPNPGSRVEPNPGPQVRRPPGPAEKEVKTKIRNGQLAIRAVVGFTTEFLDAANIAYDALPEKCKPGYYQLRGKGGKTFWKRRWRANQAQRLRAITKCWGEMDLNKLVRGLATNQLEDFGYGQLGQAAQRARERLGLQSPTGLQTGNWDTASSKQWTEVERRKQRAEDVARRGRELEKKLLRTAIRRQKAIAKANRSAIRRSAYSDLNAKRAEFRRDLFVLRSIRKAGRVRDTVVRRTERNRIRAAKPWVPWRY
jgi:hypothetical protein